MEFNPRWVVKSTLLMSLVMILACVTLASMDAPDLQSDEPQASDLQERESNSSSEAAASGKACLVSDRYPDQVNRWCKWITKSAKKHGVSADLVAALIYQESGGDPQAYSRSGAVGLMQVMPRDGLASEFMCVNGPCFADRPTIDELMDPKYNVEYGVKMLAGLIDRHQDVREALKSYGPMDVGYSYADTVLAIYNRYRKE